MLKESAYINGEDRTNFICLECGSFIGIVTDNLDEEILEEYRRQKPNETNKTKQTNKKQ